MGLITTNKTEIRKISRKRVDVLNYEEISIMILITTYNAEIFNHIPIVVYLWKEFNWGYFVE